MGENYNHTTGVYTVKVHANALASLQNRGELTRCTECGLYVEAHSIKDGRCLQCLPIPNIRFAPDIPQPLTMLCGCWFAKDEAGVFCFYHCTPTPPQEAPALPPMLDQAWVTARILERLPYVLTCSIDNAERAADLAHHLIRAIINAPRSIVDTADLHEQAAFEDTQSLSAPEAL